MTFMVTDQARMYGPWAISKASIAETCEAQFAHKYLHKTTAAASPSQNNVGTAAHSILEYRVGGKDRATAEKDALAKAPLTSGETEDLQVLKTNIEDFLKRFDYFCKTNGVTQVLREVPWGFRADYTPCDFFAKDVYFRGKIDLGAITRDHDLIVVDYKSGFAKDITKDPKFKVQLNSYAVLAYPHIPDLAGVRGGIHFLQGQEDLRSQWLPYIPATRIPQVYAAWLFDYLNKVAERLVAPFVARPKAKGWPCGWCNYRPACEPYQELVRGKKT